MKRMISILLAVCLLAPLGTRAFAEDGSDGGKHIMDLLTEFEEDAEQSDETEQADEAEEPGVAEEAVKRATLATSSYYVVGIKEDGTVVAAGSDTGKCDVSGWKNIIEVYVGGRYTVGLRSDGRVELTAEGDAALLAEETSQWTDIVAVALGFDHVVGLRSDGTVVAAVACGFVGQDNVGHWTDIVAVFAWV